MDDLVMISELASDSLGGALLLLVIGWAVTLLTRAATGAVLAIQGWLVRRRKCRQLLVDLVIHTRFMTQNGQVKVSPANIAGIKALIDASPAGFRAYVLATPEDGLPVQWRQYRHNFSSGRYKMSDEQIGRVDAYLESARLYTAYYESLCSDAFAALSKIRQKAVLDNLQRMGRDMMALAAKVREIKCLAEIDDGVSSLF